MRLLTIHGHERRKRAMISTNPSHEWCDDCGGSGTSGIAIEAESVARGIPGRARTQCRAARRRARASVSRENRRAGCRARRSRARARRAFDEAIDHFRTAAQEKILIADQRAFNREPFTLQKKQKPRRGHHRDGTAHCPERFQTAEGEKVGITRPESDDAYHRRTVRRALPLLLVALGCRRRTVAAADAAEVAAAEAAEVAAAVGEAVGAGAAGGGIVAGGSASFKRSS